MGAAGGGGGVRQTSGNPMLFPSLPLWKSPIMLAKTVLAILVPTAAIPAPQLVDLDRASLDPVDAGRPRKHVLSLDQHLSSAGQGDRRLSAAQGNLVVPGERHSLSVHPGFRGQRGGRLRREDADDHR